MDTLITLWEAHLAFEPEEARGLGLPAEGTKDLSRLEEQIALYEKTSGHPALERLARLAVHRHARGDDFCNLERSLFPLWTRTPETDRFLAQQEARLREGIRRGITPDRGLVEHFVAVQLPAALAAAKTDEERAAWRRHLALFADELRQAARPGAWRLGEDEYRLRLAWMGIHASLSARASSVLAEVQEAICQRLDVPTFADARPKLSALAAPKAERPVELYRALNARLCDFVRARGLFDLPEGFEVRLEPIAPGMEAVTHAGNVPAPILGEGEGAFLVLDDPTRHALNWALPLAVHEGVPGHYLQSHVWQRCFRGSRAPFAFVSIEDSIASERGDWGAMLAIEGWAVYAEELMIREGLYEDPAIEAIALSFHAIRCVRALIDEGLHTGAMSEEEAIELYEREAGLERAHAEREILRSQRIPTQLATYFAGWQKIEEAITSSELAPKEARRWLLEQGPILI